MSKPKQYDRSDLLNRAVELFRRQGYNGTSTAELASELGVNKKSMYAEFGSKQGLFEATLEYYSDNHLSRVLAPLEAADADIKDIRTAFHDYASASEGPFRGLGCLLCNTAVERGALDEGSGPYIDNYLDRISRAFLHSLSNAQNSGKINDEVNLETMSEFLTTLMIGMTASIRAEAPPSQLWSTYKVVTSMLDTLVNKGT